jgi:uncharacterized protein YoxC
MSWFKSFFSAQGTALLDFVQQNDRPIFKYISDVSESEIQSTETEAKELAEKAERVSRYIDAIELKADAVEEIFNANVKLETKVIGLSQTFNTANQRLIPKRREYRKIPRTFRVGANAIRGNQSGQKLLNGWIE